MAENEHAITYGTTIEYGNSSPAATALAGVKDIPSMPNLVSDETEISRLDQVSPVKQFAATMVDAGQLQLVLGLVEASVAAVYTLFRVAKHWRINFSSGATLDFEGWVKEIGQASNGANGEITMPITIRVTSMPVFTAAA